jgi:flagellar motor switch protein FliN/FliY
MADDNNPEISADDWGAAMAEQTMVAPPAAEPAADDWGAAMAEQTAAEPAADDWGAAMAEQTAAEPAPANPAQPHTFQQLDTGAAPPGAIHQDIDLIMDIPVQLSVELGRTKMPIKDLLQLAQGSVVELSALAGEPMDILINGLLLARGEVVLVNEKLGIRVTDIITPSERLRRLSR